MNDTIQWNPLYISTSPSTTPLPLKSNPRNTRRGIKKGSIKVISQPIPIDTRRNTDSNLNRRRRESDQVSNLSIISESDGGHTFTSSLRTSSGESLVTPTASISKGSQESFGTYIPVRPPRRLSRKLPPAMTESLECLSLPQSQRPSISTSQYSQEIGNGKMGSSSPQRYVLEVADLSGTTAVDEDGSNTGSTGSGDTTIVEEDTETLKEGGDLNQTRRKSSQFSIPRKAIRRSLLVDNPPTSFPPRVESLRNSRISTVTTSSTASSNTVVSSSTPPSNNGFAAAGGNKDVPQLIFRPQSGMVDAFGNNKKMDRFSVMSTDSTMSEGGLPALTPNNSLPSKSKGPRNSLFFSYNSHSRPGSAGRPHPSSSSSRPSSANSTTSAATNGQLQKGRLQRLEPGTEPTNSSSRSIHSTQYTPSLVHSCGTLPDSSCRTATNSPRMMDNTNNSVFGNAGVDYSSFDIEFHPTGSKRKETRKERRDRKRIEKEKFSEGVNPTMKELFEASLMDLIDENGEKCGFGELVRGKKTVVVFIRHWFCPLCAQYIKSILQQVSPQALEEAGVNLIIIGNGSYKMINGYNTKYFKSPFKCYTDPTLSLYRALGLTRQTGDAGEDEEKGDYLVQSAMEVTKETLKRATKMPLRNPGHFLQLGGEFIFENGPLKCVYTHRMINTRSHAPIRDICEKAGVRLEFIHYEPGPSPPPVHARSRLGLNAVSDSENEQQSSLTGTRNVSNGSDTLKGSKRGQNRKERRNNNVDGNASDSEDDSDLDNLSDNDDDEEEEEDEGDLFEQSPSEDDIEGGELDNWQAEREKLLDTIKAMRIARREKKMINLGGQEMEIVVKDPKEEEENDGLNVKSEDRQSLIVQVA